MSRIQINRSSISRLGDSPGSVNTAQPGLSPKRLISSANFYGYVLGRRM